MYTMLRTFFLRFIIGSFTIFGVVISTSFANKLPDDLSLGELLNMKMTVASQGKALTERESPGIVTIITAEEIKKTGARDLVDVLRTVPGFDFENDMSYALGIGIRGTWATEGKVLILLDNIELNDDLYLSFPFGQHIPIDNIDRIEIIRGPGSAVYGGAAELGVISITTKSALKPLGVHSSLSSGLTSEIPGHYSGTATIGSKPNSAISAVGTFHYNKGYIGDRTGSDPYGYEVPFGSGDNAKSSNMHINIGLQFDSLSARLIIDRYSLLNFPREYMAISNYRIDFSSFLGKLRYSAKLSDNLMFKPNIEVKYQIPWYIMNVFDDTGEEVSDWEMDISSSKLSLTLPLTLQITDELAMIAGVSENGVYGNDRRGTMTFNGENSVVYSNTGAFLEGHLASSVGNFTAGGRVEYHNQYGVSAVPRFAYTKAFNDIVSLKMLLSGGYRTPSLLNIAVNSEIKPERTGVFETELGIKPLPWLFCSVNGFAMQVWDGISFFYDTEGEQHYENSDQTRTGGFEFVAKVKHESIFVNVNYSLARVISGEQASYRVPGVESRNLALPEHKFSVATGSTFARQLTITPSLLVIGPRWALDRYEYSDETTFVGNVYEEAETSILVNLCVIWEIPWVRGLDVSVSVHNLLNDDFSYIQAYDGGDAPLPGLSRELMTKITYSF